MLKAQKRGHPEANKVQAVETGRDQFTYSHNQSKVPERRARVQKQEVSAMIQIYNYSFIVNYRKKPWDNDIETIEQKILSKPKKAVKDSLLVDDSINGSSFGP